MQLALAQAQAAALPAGAAPGSGSFKVTLLPSGGSSARHFFSVTPESGVLSPGQRTLLTVSFAPPRPALPAAGAASASASSLSVPSVRKPSCWQEVTATVLLSGGLVLEGAPAERSIKLLLRGFVPESVS